ncbi:MAG TPA: alpha/beta hydrolase [Gaiellaceae bacterium]|nr:alpha/beta hydrolase [Gaiellaceae bacterium]
MSAQDLGFQHVFEPGTSPWTILLLHGTGGDEHDLLPLGRQLAPGAALLSPLGKVREGSAPRFFRRLAVGQLDIPDLLARTDELAAFVASATGVYALDPARLVALGLSNGANIAVSLLFRHPGLLRAAGLLRPMLPYDPDDSLELTGTDVLVDVGSHDPLTSAANAESLVQALERAGAGVTTHIEQGAGHGLTQNDLAVAAHWFEHLIDAPPPAE